MRFLFENEAVINLKEGFLNLDGCEYEISGCLENKNQPENSIIEKTRTFSLTNPSDKIARLLKEMKNDNPLFGKIPKIPHKIELISEFNKTLPEYPVPIGMQRDVLTHLETLIDNNIISEQDTSYIYPAFIIKKKNGKLRLVVDYRYLNSITKKVHKFTPNMFELLGKLKEFKFYSCIDLNQGYYQIPIENKDTEKTGFRILNRTFVFHRMPFRLSNAPSTFQKAMNHLFRGVENCIIYFDDILIYTKDIGTHYETLKKVFQIIKENNIFVNFEKSEFVKRQINFLGHTITEKGIIQNSTISVVNRSKPRNIFNIFWALLIGIVRSFLIFQSSFIQYMSCSK
ncbi:Retrovirus-related Pol polyprotein from transposon 17.6 [Dictyocoela roeselum]|nr:Retrovirus-related Pol polyprotein from transposon 17.6 [Dictyocoela roeselum]